MLCRMVPLCKTDRLNNTFIQQQTIVKLEMNTWSTRGRCKERVEEFMRREAVDLLDLDVLDLLDLLTDENDIRSSIFLDLVCT